MANELVCVYSTGNTLYAHLFDATGQIYNGSGFEAPTSGNWANYDIAMSEAATSTQIYRGTMPGVAAGAYSFVVRLQAGGSPAVADIAVAVGDMQWDGSAKIALDDIATGGAGADPHLLLSTTIASVTSQTEFTLTAGADFNSAYAGQGIILTDASNNDYPSIRVIQSYVGSTKTVTIDSAPDFTIIAADGVKIVAAPEAFVADAGIAAASFASGAIDVSAIAAAAANMIADHILRRAYGTSRVSGNGDTLSQRSLLGAVAKLVNKIELDSVDEELVVYHEDDSTEFYAQEYTDDSDADPVTSLG